MKRRGQSVVEYILLVTAVLLVFIALLASRGKVRTAIEKDLNAIVPAIDQGTNSLRFPG